MRSVGRFVSRRCVVCASGAAFGAALLPLSGSAQTPASPVLTARTGTANLRAGNAGPTPIRGFEGTVPGPTLRVKRGEELRVRLMNELVTDMTVHWHGVRVPNAMDGVAGLTQPAVAPGDSFDYRFSPPDAGTFWYYAPSRFIEDRALYGLLIVEEPERIDVDRDVPDLADLGPRPHDVGHCRAHGPDLGGGHLVQGLPARLRRLRQEGGRRLVECHGAPRLPLRRCDRRRRR